MSQRLTGPQFFGLVKDVGAQIGAVMPGLQVALANTIDGVLCGEREKRALQDCVAILNELGDMINDYETQRPITKDIWSAKRTETEDRLGQLRP